MSVIITTRATTVSTAWQAPCAQLAYPKLEQQWRFDLTFPNIGTRTHACMHICVHARAHTHARTHARTHTHTHTHTRVRADRGPLAQTPRLQTKAARSTELKTVGEPLGVQRPARHHTGGALGDKNSSAVCSVNPHHGHG
jgi:hypothetical protein